MNIKIVQINTKIVPKLSNYHNLDITVDILSYITNTPRLILTPFIKNDTDFYYQLFSNKQVMHNYADGITRSVTQVDDLMSYYIQCKLPYYFSIFDKYTKNFIGTIFLTQRNQPPNTLLLGYLLLPQYWDNNYTKEALYALIYGLKPIIWPNHYKIIATCNIDNIASQKILQAFNFKLKKIIKKFGITKILYSY